MYQRLESSLERRCVALAKLYNCLFVKIQGTKGWPDRLLLTPGGVYIWVELKRLGEQPTKLQLYIHSLIRKRGGRVEVIDQVLDFESLLP